MTISDEERDRILAEGRAAEREAQLRRRLAGKQAAKKQGRHVHGKVPYGYTTLKRGELVPDRSRVETVARIFRAVANGDSASRVARRLNEITIPSPGGVRWSAQSVTIIIRNRAYLGERYGVRAHQALISAPLFDEANAALDKRRKKPKAAAQ